MSEDQQAAADVEPELVSDGPPEQVQLLLAENERLRAERDAAHAGRSRRGALGFAVLGLLSAAAGYALPESQTLLFSLAGAGLFGAVITYYLTTAPSSADSTAQDVYTAYVGTLTEIAGELGLRDVSVYVPTDDSDRSDGVADVRLFVPQQASYELPDNPDSVFVARAGDSRRGIAVRPTGSVFFTAFEQSLRDPLAETPSGLATQLAAALVEDFELVSEATPEYDADNDRITVLVRGSTLGPVDRFDHPVVSFVATGLARALDRPVRTEVHEREGGASLVVCTLLSASDAERTDA